MINDCSAGTFRPYCKCWDCPSFCSWSRNAAKWSCRKTRTGSAVEYHRFSFKRLKQPSWTLVSRNVCLTAVLQYCMCHYHRTMTIIPLIPFFIVERPRPFCTDKYYQQREKKNGKWKVREEILWQRAGFHWNGGFCLDWTRGEAEMTRKIIGLRSESNTTQLLFKQITPKGKSGRSLDKHLNS